MSRTMKLILSGDARRLSRTFRQASGDVNSFGQRLKRFAAAGALAATVALGAMATAAVDAVKDFAAFDKGVREVATLLGDVSDHEIAQLGDSIREVSREFGQNTTDVARAFYDAISAGVANAETAQGFAEQAAKFATAGATDISTGVDVLSSAINAYGLSAADAGAVSDTLFATVRAGKTTVAELAANFSQVGPVAASAGVGLSEAMGWVAQLTLSGTPTAQAMTQVRSALVELMNPAKKLAKEFERAAGESFPDFIAGGGSLQEALALLDAHMETSGKSAIEMTSRIEGAQAVLGATGDKAEQFADTMDSVADSTGAADTAFETMAEGGAFKMAQFEATIQDVKLAVGQALMPAIEALLPLVQRLEPLFEGIAAVTKFVAEAIEGFAGTVDIAMGRTAEGADRLGRRTRDSFGAAAHAAVEAGDSVQRNLGDRIPHHADAGAKAAETFESRTRSSFGAVITDAERIGDSMTQLSTSMIAATNRGIGAADDFEEATTSAAEASQGAVDSMIPGLKEFAATGVDAYSAVEEAIREFEAAQDRARTRHRIALHQLANDYETAYLRGIELGEAIKAAAETSSTTTSRTLSDAERLAAGMAVTMTDACGSVVGFRQCVDGMVVEFDANMNRVQTDAETFGQAFADEFIQLSAVAVSTSRNVCGELESVTVCMNGVERTISTDAAKIARDLGYLGADVAAESRNVCGELETITVCIDGVATVIDAATGEIISDLDAVAAAAERAGDSVEASAGRIGGAFDPSTAYGRAQQARLDRGAKVYERARTGQLLAADLPDRVAAIADAYADEMGLPRLASGGVVTRPTVVLAGESGTEAILPLSALDRLGGPTELNLRVTLELEGEQLGEFVIEKVQLADDRGELDLRVHG